MCAGVVILTFGLPLFLLLNQLTMIDKNNPNEGVLFIPFILMICLFIVCMYLGVQDKPNTYIVKAYWVSVGWFYLQVVLTHSPKDL